jgi:hypothetical protein
MGKNGNQSMLPKYLYRQKSYKVILMGDKAGQNIEELVELFAKANFYPLALRDDWQECIGEASSIAEWRELNEEAYFALKIELDILGASGEVIETETFEVFDDKVLSFNKSYSGALLRLEEYAFILWAKQENIEEAYRLTILPWFSTPQIVRIYRKDGLSYFVYKLGSKHYFETSLKIKKSSHLLLESAHWEKLAQFMHENFWMAKTWYNRYYRMPIRDGVHFLFEGWKNGQYKLLADHSPDSGDVSDQAIQLFRAIKIHAIGESLGHQSKFIPPVL